ncbi:hypothetical protein OAS86_04070 [Gammaproteobacteria bacterium]|nr:hypothetical protein [Gammaproteobacteria bacterium]
MATIAEIVSGSITEYPFDYILKTPPLDRAGRIKRGPLLNFGFLQKASRCAACLGIQVID